MGRLDRILNSIAIKFHRHHVATSRLHCLLDRRRNLARLPSTVSDFAISIAHNSQSCEAKNATTFNNFGDPIYLNQLFLQFTLLLSFTGYLLPWDQLALWAVTVGTNMMGYTPVFGEQVRFVLLGGVEIGTDTLLRWYVLHVLLLPFVLVIFMAIHFWRVRKDGGISGPL